MNELFILRPQKFIKPDVFNQNMETAIYIDDETKHLLDNVRTTQNINSYNEAIRHLVQNHLDSSTMFGVTKQKPLRFSKQDEMDFHEKNKVDSEAEIIDHTIYAGRLDHHADI